MKNVDMPKVGDKYRCDKYCIGRYQTIKDKEILGVREYLDAFPYYKVTYVSNTVVAVSSDFYPENEVVLTLPEFQRCFTRLNNQGGTK